MRILLLTHRVPYAPNRGDRIRAYHLMRHLARFADVHLVSFAHSDEESRAAAGLDGQLASMTLVRPPRLRNLLHAGAGLPTGTPLTHLLLDAPDVHRVLGRVIERHPPDLVFAYCSGMARFGVEPPLAGLPLVVDFVDIDSAKWATLATQHRPPKRWIYRREARLLARFERRVAHAARATLVVNERESRALGALAPDAPPHVVPNGIDLEAFRPAAGPAGAPVVVFCGVMDYGPNVEGVLWFARHVWPLVRKALPTAMFIIVGAQPVPQVRALRAQPGIEVTGSVDDVRRYLWSAAVSVAPLKTARGLQNKVLEALAAGLPSVITPEVFEGLPDEVHPGVRVASEAPAFATAVLDLLAATPASRRAMAEHARLEVLGWDRQLAPLRGILESAVGTGLTGG